LGIGALLGIVLTLVSMVEVDQGLRYEQQDWFRFSVLVTGGHFEH